MSTTSQQVLAALGQRIGVFHVHEIQKMTNLSGEQIQGALKTLVRRGFVERRGTGLIKATAEGWAFLSVENEIKPGPTAPRRSKGGSSNLRDRLWKALRLAQKATIPELLELAARGSEINAALNAKDYLNALVRSGHVIRLTRRAPPVWPATTGASRYCLILDTGPQAPTYNPHRKSVFDPNTGETFDVASALA